MRAAVSIAPPQRSALLRVPPEVGLAIAALIAGCASEGIYVEVRPPADVSASTVELFLGLRDCTVETDGGNKACDRMQPAEFPRPDQASVYFRQPEVLVAEVEGGAAKFRFASESKQLPVVIAVAFDNETPVAAGTIQNLDLGGDPLHVILELSKAQKLTPDTSSGGDAARVTVWSRDRALKCVGAELPGGGRAYVVPESDPDCDAAPMECDPLGYLVTRPGDQPCVDTLPAASGPACMLGGTPCREDPNAQAPACVPDFVPDCVPGVVCSCAPTDRECLKGKLANSGVARVACRFASQPNPQRPLERIPCETDLGAQPAKLELTLLPFSLACTESPELGPVELPLAFAGEVALADQTIKTRDFVAGSCGVSLEWRGAVLPVTPPRIDALIGFVVEAGAAAKRRHVVLPMSITYEATCAEEQTCALVPMSDQDSVWACAH